MKDLQYKAAVYYIIIFYTLFFYKLLNGLLLCQMQPLFLFARYDIFAFLFLQTNLPQWLSLHPQYFVVCDALFYIAPLLFLFAVFKGKQWMQFAAFIMLCINWAYIQCYTLYPTNSVTLYIAWLIVPVIFLAKKEALFCLLFQGLRYFFLYFFFSAGMWKTVNGGVFNPLQMSTILLEQHKEILAANSHWWLQVLIAWLIAHAQFAYTLYVAVTCLELLFGLGFFTRKYDKILAGIYIFFLLADHLIMRIPYYETMPFLLCFYLQPNNFTISKR